MLEVQTEGVLRERDARQVVPSDELRRPLGNRLMEELDLEDEVFTHCGREAALVVEIRQLGRDATADALVERDTKGWVVLAKVGFTVVDDEDGGLEAVPVVIVKEAAGVIAGTRKAGHANDVRVDVRGHEKLRKVGQVEGCAVLVDCGADALL